MEPRHKQYIFKNLEKLIKLTDVNVLVLAHLQSKGVIDEGECQKLDLPTLTKFEKASKLYKILINKTDSYRILHEALNATLQTGAVEVLLEGLDAKFDHLETSFDSEPDEGSNKFDKRQVLFDVQAPCSLFEGRKKELEDLHKLMNESNRRTVITHITSVSGLGGVGKTQLARKYAQDYKCHYDKNVVWINSESEQALISSFTKLATDKLEISTKNANNAEKDISIVVQDCYESKYFRNRKCLFVFDNVEKEKYLTKFLPLKDSSQNIYVLMTSRHQDWGKLVNKLEVNVFSEEEAIAFVKNGLELESGAFEDSIRLIVCRLQYFPLAISQAISYISNQQKMGDYSISKYLNEFEVNIGHYLDCDLSDELESDYAKTTFTTWKMTIDKIAQIPQYGDLAVEILHLVAYFSPDDIHRDAFLQKSTKFYQNLVNTVAILFSKNTQEESPVLLEKYTDETVKQAVNLLVTYSMVLGQDNQSIISIHRLVQEVVRINLRRTGKEKETIKMGLQLAEECPGEKFILHAISVWKYAEGMPELICEFVDLAARIIQTLRDVGRYNEACKFGVNSLEKLKTSRSVNKRSILHFQLCLAEVFKFSGNYETSLYYLERVQEECKTLANIDQFFLQVQEQIGWVFESQGRYSEAFELGVKMCERSKLIFGDGHLRTARSLFMTAVLAWKMGNYDLSYSTFQDGFICYEKATEKDELSFFYARVNFALLVRDRGNINEAISILEDIKAKIFAYPGLNVPICLKTKTFSKLGIYLNATNRHVEAHKIFEELYNEQNNVLGEDHEETLKTLNNLGVSLLHLKRYEEGCLACSTALLKLKKK